MRFVPLEKLINLEDGYRREFLVEYHRVLLLQHDGERYLLEARCPHLEHPLMESRLEGGEIVCPLHGYRFSLRTGTLIHATHESCRPLKVWPVVYEGQDVGIALESQ